MIPELNLGIIVLTNQQEGGAFTSITNQIKDAYLGVKGYDRVSQYAGYRKKQLLEAQKTLDSIWQRIEMQQKKATTVDYSVYSGTFNDNWFGDITIGLRAGHLWFQSKRSPKLRGDMYYYQGNTFVVKWTDRSMDADAFVSFGLDETGMANTCTMKAISPLTDFSFDFQDLSFKKK